LEYISALRNLYSWSPGKYQKQGKQKKKEKRKEKKKESSNKLFILLQDKNVT